MKIGKWICGEKAFWAGDRATGLESFPNHGFGSYARFKCWGCGETVYQRPPMMVIDRQTFTYPSEWAFICPGCGSIDVEEIDCHEAGFRVRKREVIRL